MIWGEKNTCGAILQRFNRNHRAVDMNLAINFSIDEKWIAHGGGQLEVPLGGLGKDLLGV